MALVAVSETGAQPMSVDTRSQYQMYIKVLAFDKALLSRVGDEVVIGILYNGASRESRWIKDEMAREIDAGPKDLEGRAIRSIAVPLGDPKKLAAEILRDGIDILYVCPLDPYSMSPVTGASRAAGVATFTGVVDYVSRGISVGFRISGRGAKILVNLAAAKAEGSDFSSRLLSVVTVMDKTSGGITP